MHLRPFDAARRRTLVRRTLVAGLLPWFGIAAAGPATTGLPPLADDAAWQAAMLPRQKLPATSFAATWVDGRPALRIESSGSYGNRLHRVVPPAPAQGSLNWHWKVERFPAGADLRRREGDDAAIKLCVLFDLPVAHLPFIERQRLRIARLATGEAIPAATLCYVWDAVLPAGTVLPNAYTQRLRWLVLRGHETPPGTWQGERRDLRADFLQVFGDETASVPPIVGILFGADADNTASSGLAYLSALEWQR